VNEEVNKYMNESIIPSIVTQRKNTGGFVGPESTVTGEGEGEGEGEG